LVWLLIPFQLPLSPMMVFGVGIELPDFVSVDRLQHANLRHHQVEALDAAFLAGEERGELPFEAELLACRRHFWKTFPYATAPVAAAGQPGMWLANQVVGAAGAMQFPSMYYPVPMRIAPIVTGFNPTAAGSQFRNYVTGTDCAGTSLVPYETSWTATTTTPAGSAAGQALGIHLTFDASI
jgi:hypothetical protein